MDDESRGSAEEEMISRGLMIRVGSQDDDGRPIDRRKLNELLKLPHRICSSTAAGPAALPCAASMNGEENPRRTNPLFSQTPDPNYRYVSVLGSSRAAVSACAIVHLLSTEHTLTLSHTRTLANHTTQSGMFTRRTDVGRMRFDHSGRRSLSRHWCVSSHLRRRRCNCD